MKMSVLLLSWRGNPKGQLEKSDSSFFYIIPINLSKNNES